MKVAVLIDGGHLRVMARRAGFDYGPDFIATAAKACLRADETAFRYLYYDCPPYSGTTRLPVSGQDFTFVGSDGWLKTLAAKDLFAVRLGVLKFRGFTPKRVPISAAPLTDDDFSPTFEQKGVDMRIGLDIATFCKTGAVERVALMTNDTDCIPAMKYARIAGLQVILVKLPGVSVAAELLRHADFHRQLEWPS